MDGSMNWSCSLCLSVEYAKCYTTQFQPEYSDDTCLSSPVQFPRGIPGDDRRYLPSPSYLPLVHTVQSVSACKTTTVCRVADALLDYFKIEDLLLLYYYRVTLPVNF